MPNYVLLLHESPDLAPDLGPQEMQAAILRYRKWADRLRDSGHLKGRSKLVDCAGRVLRKDDSDVRITDGPFVETKDVIGGIFTITAETYEQVVEMSRDCPHLEFGPIEIREIEVT
jgi:hypothetical protein